MIQLKAASSGRLSIGNGDVVDFDTGANFTIPEGHVGILLPAKTQFIRKFYELTADIAPGHQVIPAGSYESFIVKLYNSGPTGLRYELGDVLAQLVVIPCLDISLNIGQGSASSDSSASSTTNKKSSTGTAPSGSTKTSSPKKKK